MRKLANRCLLQISGGASCYCYKSTSGGRSRAAFGSSSFSGGDIHTETSVVSDTQCWELCCEGSSLTGRWCYGYGSSSRFDVAKLCTEKPSSCSIM